jgi:hypothetical protein
MNETTNNVVCEKWPEKDQDVLHEYADPSGRAV